MPMADGANYEVWITQSGLVARPDNDAARAASAGGFGRSRTRPTAHRPQPRPGWISFWLITTVWPRKRSMIERT